MNGTLGGGGDATIRGSGGEMDRVEMVSLEGGDMMKRLEVVRLRVFVGVEMWRTAVVAIRFQSASSL